MFFLFQPGNLAGQLRLNLLRQSLVLEEVARKTGQGLRNSRRFGGNIMFSMKSMTDFRVSFLHDFYDFNLF